MPESSLTQITPRWLIRHTVCVLAIGKGQHDSPLRLKFALLFSPPEDLYLISEKSIWANQV